MNATTSPALVAAEDTQTPVDDQATAPATTTEPTETPAGETPLEDVTDWSELDRRLAAVDAPEPETPAATQEEPAETEPTEETPDATEADDDEPQADPNKPLPKNFRLRTEDPKRAKLYQLQRQNPDADPIALAKLAGYDVPTGTTPKTEQATPEPESDPLQPLRDEITNLAAQKKELRDAYKYDELDELNDKLLEKRLELERRSREVQEEKAEKVSYDATYEDSRTAAAKLHPAAAQPGTKQFRLVRMLVAAKEQETPEFFNDPDYPLRLLGELERDFPESFPKKGAAPVVPAAKPAAQPAKTPPAARPVGQTVPGTAGGPKKLSAEDINREVNSLTMEQLTELSNAVGTHPGRNKA